MYCLTGELFLSDFLTELQILIYILGMVTALQLVLKSIIDKHYDKTLSGSDSVT